MRRRRRGREMIKRKMSCRRPEDEEEDGEKEAED